MRNSCSFKRTVVILVLTVSTVCVLVAQELGRVRVEVFAANEVVTAAEVVVSGTTVLTDAAGVVAVSVPAGDTRGMVIVEGFLPATVSVDVVAGQERVVRIDLVEQPALEEEVTVVATTRTDRRIEDQPLRVEVLNREEIEEKILMTPGDIVMMLNEMGGMRVQTTSPSLGAASVRIQGMRGRYTRFLSDGLPLYGSQPGGLGLLQIPPMDLGQVEVIKGVASALYGAGAMGGVVNLLSRRPGDEPERILEVARDMGVTVKVIANSHGHGDHVMAISGIKAVSNIPFLIHNAELSVLQSSSQSMKEYLGDNVRDIPNPDGYVVDNGKVSVLGLDLHVIHTPGHTPGSVSYSRWKL